MASGKIKLAIIGYGGMGGWHHLRMKLSGIIDVVGAYDTDPQALRKAKLHGLKVFANADELFGDADIESVLITTPNDSHEQYVIAAAKAGKHIICEKPVTLCSDSFIRMTAATDKHGVIFSVHQNRRWDGDYLRMKRIFAEPLMGKVYRIESNVSSSHGLPGSWRKIKEKGGGMLWDWGVHLIDQLLQATDSKVVAVYCRASYVYGFDVDDGIHMYLDFQSGLEASIVINTNDFIRCPRWKVFGENGTGIVKRWRSRGKMTIVKERIDKKNKGMDAGNGFTKTMADRSRGTVKTLRLGNVPSRKPSFYQGFYNAVREGAPQPISHESVMRCMKVMEAGFCSIAQKSVIKTDI